jgi:ribosomal protein L11 methyltransferase
VKRWPALDIHVPIAGRDADEAAGLFAAFLDDYVPTAITELPAHGRDAIAWRAFFATPEDRTGAAAAILADRAWPGARAEAIDVDDEAWAERSQASLTAIRVAGIVVTPPWDRDRAAALGADPADGPPAGITVVIEPSMGFGTGHHESTRLCLAALQRTPLAGGTVLDVGTGSGVLAIAAARLGARHVLAVDADRDALDSAEANVALNAVAPGVIEARVADVLADSLPAADVVLGNLTGALLRRAADRLRAAVVPGGTLIVSGFTEDERLAVEHAFAPLAVVGAESEHGWLALTFRADQDAGVQR